MLPCHRRNDVEEVQQDNTDKNISNARLIHRSAADEDCSCRKEAGLIMRIIGAHISHILQEDNLPDTGKHRRNDNRNNPRPLNRNTGGKRNGLILPDCPHILPKLCLSKPHDKKHSAMIIRYERSGILNPAIVSGIAVSSICRTGASSSVLRTPYPRDSIIALLCIGITEPSRYSTKN